MKLKWVRLIIDLSSKIYAEKQKLLITSGVSAICKIAFKIIWLQLAFIVVSFPTHFFYDLRPQFKEANVHPSQERHYVMWHVVSIVATLAVVAFIVIEAMLSATGIFSPSSSPKTVISSEETSVSWDFRDGEEYEFSSDLFGMKNEQVVFGIEEDRIAPSESEGVVGDFSLVPSNGEEESDLTLPEGQVDGQYKTPEADGTDASVFTESSELPSEDSVDSANTELSADTLPSEDTDQEDEVDEDVPSEGSDQGDAGVDPMIFEDDAPVSDLEEIAGDGAELSDPESLPTADESQNAMLTDSQDVEPEIDDGLNDQNEAYGGGSENLLSSLFFAHAYAQADEADIAVQDDEENKEIAEDLESGDDANSHQDSEQSVPELEADTSSLERTIEQQDLAQEDEDLEQPELSEENTFDGAVGAKPSASTVTSGQENEVVGEPNIPVSEEDVVGENESSGEDILSPEPLGDFGDNGEKENMIGEDIPESLDTETDPSKTSPQETENPQQTESSPQESDSDQLPNESISQTSAQNTETSECTGILQPKNALAIPEGATLSSFREHADKNGGEIGYQLSADEGDTWYAWSGDEWVSSSQVFTLATELNAYIASFPLEQNTILFRAQFSSNCQDPIILSKIRIDYEMPKIKTPLTPISHWKFDEESGSVAFDSGQNKNDGIIFYGTRVDGVEGSAIDFDEDRDGIWIQETSSLALDGDMSLSFWINITSLPPEKKEYTLMTFTAPGANEPANTLYELRLNADGEILSRHEHGYGQEEHMVFPTDISEGSWHLITFVRNADAKQNSLYVDADLVKTLSYSQNPTGGTSARLYIGTNIPNTGLAALGAFDEVEVYGDMLSEKEIVQYYQTMQSTLEYEKTTSLSTPQDTSVSPDLGNTPVITIDGVSPQEDGSVNISYTLGKTDRGDLELTTIEYSLSGEFAGEEVKMTSLSPINTKNAENTLPDIAGEDTGISDIPEYMPEDGDGVEQIPEAKTSDQLAQTDPSEDSVSAQNESEIFAWDAVADEVDVASQDIFLRLVANDGNEEFASTFLFAPDQQQIKPFTVASISARQIRGEGKVLIQYELSSDEEIVSMPGIEVSQDGGVTWQVPSSSIEHTRERRHIVWNAGQDFSGQDQDDMRVRVQVSEGKYVISPEFSVDTKAPVGLERLRTREITPTSVVLSWDKIGFESNFKEYQIWYGQNRFDVESQSGTARKWNVARDRNLNFLTTTSSEITGLNLVGLNIIVPTDEPYFAKLIASDYYGNESSEVVEFFTPFPE